MHVSHRHHTHSTTGIQSWGHLLGAKGAEKKRGTEMLVEKWLHPEMKWKMEKRREEKHNIFPALSAALVTPCINLLLPLQPEKLHDL